MKSFASSGLFFLLLTFAPQVFAQTSLTFEKDIQPIFAAKCEKCHGEKAKEANLDLRSIAAIKRGGDSGTPLPADGEASVLWERIESGEMPPEDQPQLTKKERAIIRTWLKSGAKSNNRNDTRDEWASRLEAAKKYWAFAAAKRPRLARTVTLPVSPTMANGEFDGKD